MPTVACPALVARHPHAAPCRTAAITLATALALAGCNATAPKLAQSAADQASSSQTGASSLNPVASAPASSGAAIVAAATAPATPGCEKLPTMSDKSRTAMATGLGAAAGVFISMASGGSKAKHHITGALGGALVGALASSTFKNDIDVEEQPDGSVRVKIPGSVMFASGQATPAPGDLVGQSAPVDNTAGAVDIEINDMVKP